MTALILLAILQGITEMLPVSSSGHLALAKQLTSFTTPAGWLEAMLHFGTLLAIIVFYRKPIINLLVGLCKLTTATWIYAAQIVAASFPICLVGFVFKSDILSSFDNPVFIACCLCFTGLVVGSVFRANKSDSTEIGWGKLLAVGLAQTVAILPGVSRSGMTISTARHLGIKAEKAAEISFMISLIPLSGATALSMLDAMDAGTGGISVAHLIVGVLVSGLTGYLALVILIRSLSSKTFPWFGVYCLAAGAILLLTL